MNVFDFAMNMEKDGEKYYREMAEQVQDEGMKTIFGILAEDEQKHYRIFHELKKQSAPEMMDTTVLDGAKNVFVKMAETGGKSFDFDSSHVQAYKKAQDVEAQSQRFYEEQAAMLEGPARELLLRIAEEEHKHYVLLGHLIHFVERPQSWIEDAEFNHLDEY